jgi:hypothetical protein
MPLASRRDKIKFVALGVGKKRPASGIIAAGHQGGSVDIADTRRSGSGPRLQSALAFNQLRAILLA